VSFGWEFVLQFLVFRGSVLVGAPQWLGSLPGFFLLLAGEQAREGGLLRPFRPPTAGMRAPASPESRRHRVGTYSQDPHARQLLKVRGAHDQLGPKGPRSVARVRGEPGAKP